MRWPTFGGYAYPATVKETCGACGSVFEYTGPTPTSAAYEWRTGHRCVAKKTTTTRSKST